MNTLTITTTSTSAFSIGIGPYSPGPDPRVHGQAGDLAAMLQGIQRRHGSIFQSAGDAAGALWAAYLARLAGIRS
jgi:hypothetical protein